MNSILKAKKFPLNYPKDVVAIMKAMSFNIDKLNVVGSASKSSQQYSADYDMNEIVYIQKSPKAMEGFCSEFQNKIKQLMELKGCYIADIKIGEVPNWNLPVGETYAGYSSSKAVAGLKKLEAAGILSLSQVKEITGLLKPHLKESEWLALKKEAQFGVLHWNPKEILAGYKGDITLLEALKVPALFKLDCVAFIEGSRYTDFSIIYDLRWTNGESVNGFKMEEPKKSIKQDIHYYLTTGGYYKALKRIFSLVAIEEPNSELLEELSSIFNGDMGRLYSIISDVGTILFLLENEGHLSLKKIQYEIDGFRGRLGNIYTIDKVNKTSILNKLLDMTELPNTKMGRHTLEINMLTLIDYFTKILNELAKGILKESGIV